MSFDADTLFGKIKKVEKELDILRSQSRTDFSGSGGGSGGGFGVGGSTNVTPSVHASFALNPVIHRLDEAETSPYALTGSITLRGASVIVEEGTNNASSTLEFHTINGTLNNGQILTIKPKEGKTLTLKTGGNIDITADVSVADTEFVILQYFDDNTLANSNPVTGTYSLLSGGGGSSGLTNPASTSLDMGAWDINNVSELRFINNATNTGTQLRIIARDTTTADGTFDRLEYEVDNLGGHDFYVDKANTTTPRLGITETSIQSNVPLDMNLNHIIFQSITGVSAPTGNEKRFLFSNSANSDHLSVRTSTGIVDLESGGDLDNLSDVTITFPIGYGALVYDTGTSQWVNTQIRNNEVSASANIDWTKINKTGSALNDFDDTSIVNSTNTVIKFDGGLNKWVAGSVQNDQVASNANIDWTKINKTGSSLSDLDDTVIGTPNSRDIIQWSGMNWTTSKVYDDNVASTANISLSKINISTFGLDTLSDVTITGPVGNGAIIYDTGTNTWINSQVRNDQVSVSANIDQSKINLSITNSELAGGDYNAITGIGSQVQTLDMNDNMITNVEMIGIVDTGGTARGSVSGDSTQGLVFAQPLITMKDVTTNIATFSKASNSGIDFHANVSMNTNYRITDVEDPVNNQDVVTKAWHNANAGVVAKLNDIGDCTIGTTPTSNTVLKESGGGWVDGNVTYANIDSSTWADFDTNLKPITDNDYDLGSSTREWRNLYIDGTAYIDTLSLSGGSNGYVLSTNGSGTLSWVAQSGGGSWVGSAGSTLDMNTYNIEDVDQLVFSTGTSSSDVLPNTSYGIEADGGTSPIGMRYNVPSYKEHNFYINGTLEMEINSGGVNFQNNDLEGVDDIEFTTSNQKISSGSNSIDVNVDLNDWITLQVNTTEIIKVTGSNFYVYKPLQLEDQIMYEANKIYFGTTSLNKYIGSSTTNDFTMNVPSGGDIKFSENFNNFLVMDGGLNKNIFHREIAMDGGHLFRAYDSTECGYHVSNATDLGTKGTMGVPYVSAYGAVSDSTLNTYFGSTNGCIGVQYDSSNGYGYFWIKANGDWKKSFFT